MKSSKLLLLLFILSFFGNKAHAAKEYLYPIADIPKELLAEAKAVIREHEIKFDIQSKENAVLSEKLVISILNENGIGEATFVKGYDKFSKIKKIRATVYDEYGNQIKKFGTNDILDLCSASGYSGYDDSRVKIIDTEYRTYPFTIEYYYEKEYKGFLYFPNWEPFISYNISIEKSSFTVSCPTDYMFRYQPIHLNIEPSIIEESGKNIYHWEIKNKKPIKHEIFSKQFNKQDPVLLLAPSDFELDNHEGNMETWENLGLWSWGLIYDRNNFDEQTKKEIKQLVTEEQSKIEKARTLYKYLQDSKRYVSIQEGIGGWQPISSQEVHDLGYGDCKALVNYMKSALDLVNIESFYCRIRSGSFERDIIKEFPSNQFNHIILCIPNDKDTIWLECTDNQDPFGYLGSFTDDRNVLIITEKGGILGKTKAFGADVHKSTRISEVRLNEQGHGLANIKTTYSGIFYDNKKDILNLNDEKKKKRVLYSLDIPNINLVNFKYKIDKGLIPSLSEEINLELINYATIMHTRLIIPLNLNEKMTAIPQSLSERKTDIYIKRPVQNIDTVTYHIPAGYTTSNVPETKSISSEFGEYTASVTVNKNQICYARKFILNKGNYPLEKYSDFYEFLDEIRKADEVKIMLRKN